MNDPFKSIQFFFRIDDVGDVLGEAPEKVDHKHLELVYHQFIQPAREARGPEGPARWER